MGGGLALHVAFIVTVNGFPISILTDGTQFPTTPLGVQVQAKESLILLLGTRIG